MLGGLGKETPKITKC